MYNDWFHIGNITIHGYGLMVALGIATTIILCCWMSKKQKKDMEIIIDLTIVLLLSGFLGSKLLNCIVNFDQFIQNPLALLGGSGFVVYGGFVGGAIGGIIFCKIKKLDFLAYCDMIFPAVMIGHGIGRLGCFFAGCCHGKPYDGFGSITFTNSSFAPNNIPLYPTQLVSAFFLICAGIVLLIFYVNKERRKGLTTSLYLIIYSVGRFIIEFFRGDVDRGFIGFLSTSQFISIFVFILGVVLLVLVKQGKLFGGAKNGLQSN